MPDFYDISIIGGADGPTAVMVAGALWKPIAVLAAVILLIVLLIIYLKHNNE